MFHRARAATESASSLPTLCRGSGQERECGGSSRAFPATEREDTWPWGNPRCTDIIMLFNDLLRSFSFHFALSCLPLIYLYTHQRTTLTYFGPLYHLILRWSGSIYLFVAPTLSCVELQEAGAYPSTHWVRGRVHPAQGVIKGLATKWSLCRHYKGSSCPIFTDFQQELIDETISL